MEIVGYLASALIGISLGLVGSGGSILTIPVLVYLFQIEPSLATAYSLFIVGTTALVGGVRCSIQQLVDFPTTVAFAIPSIFTVYITRRFLISYIPEVLISEESVIITKNAGIMVFFALLMMAASYSMIRQSRQVTKEDSVDAVSPFTIFLIGAGTGMLTGLLGAGGGFLIIPSLVLFARLPMKKAVGTSLLIIATNSLMGFLGDIASGRTIDYAFIFLIASIAIAGIFVGNYLSRFIDGQKLKSVFGWFILVMSVYIIIREALN